MKKFSYCVSPPLLRTKIIESKYLKIILPSSPLSLTRYRMNIACRYKSRNTRDLLNTLHYSYFSHIIKN